MIKPCTGQEQGPGFTPGFIPINPYCLKTGRADLSVAVTEFQRFHIKQSPHFVVSKTSQARFEAKSLNQCLRRMSSHDDGA